MAYLRMVMQGKVTPTIPQLDAAKTIARLETMLKAGGGKKDAAADKAKKAAEGKFRSAAPPKLSVVNG